jgi:hypothetical protein
MCWILLQCTRVSTTGIFNYVNYIFQSNYHQVTASTVPSIETMLPFLLATVVYFIIKNLDESNGTVLFNGLVEEGEGPVGVPLSLPSSTSSKSSSNTQQSWYSLCTMPRSVEAAFRGMCFLLSEPGVQVSVKDAPVARTRLRNVELPQAYPWRCSYKKRKRGPRQYHLRMRIARRGDGRSTRQTNRQIRTKGRREAKGERAREEQERIPEHWKNVSEEEKLEDFERNKSRYLHRSYLMYDLRFGVSLDEIVQRIDPLSFHHKISALSADTFLTTRSQQRSMRSRAGRALIAAKDIQGHSHLT